MTFEEFIEEWRNDKDYIIVHTSGSTGDPKEIKLPKNFVRESAERTNGFFGLTRDSHFHSCVSPDFIGGKMMAVRSEMVKGKLTWENPSNQSLKDLSKDDKIDLVAVVPSQMHFILDNKDILPAIQNIIIGGSSIHPDLRSKIAASGLNAYETYGMTETSSHIALRKISSDIVPFHTLPGISVKTDEDNCLVINFDSGEEFITNDIAEIVSDTEFYILGRKDDVIISGGKKLHPSEIESILAEIIHQPFLISGIPDEKWGQKIILRIEGKEDPELNKDIEILLKQKVESWKRPKEIIYVEKLPLTPNGKIIRKKL